MVSGYDLTQVNPLTRMTLLMNLTTVLSQTLLEAAPKGLVSAYLFGSHARGQAHSESDIDVGVLLHPELYPSVQARFAARLRLTAWLIGALGVNAVDMVVLNDAPLSWVVTLSPRGPASTVPRRNWTTPLSVMYSFGPLTSLRFCVVPGGSNCKR